MTALAAAPEWDGSRLGYGLMMRELQGHPLVFHGGGMQGFGSILSHFPHDDLTIVVLANGPMPVGTVAAGIARAVLGLERDAW